MDWDYFDGARTVRNGELSALSMLGRGMKATASILGIINNMDMQSNGQGVKALLRCSCSSCFDKDNICCKVCDIKTCRCKCDFLDKDICEYQYLR